MNGIKSKALAQAMRLLNSIGVKYAIVEPDGTKHGELDVASGRKRGPATFDNLTKFNYQPKVDALKPGEVLQFVADSMDEARSLHGSISSRVTRVHGPGQCTGAVTPRPDGKVLVEFLRLEPETTDEALATVDD